MYASRIPPIMVFLLVSHWQTLLIIVCVISMYWDVDLVAQGCQLLGSAVLR